LNAANLGLTFRIRQIYNFGPLCRPTHALENPSMAAGTRNVRLFVSEQCFALLVDAMAAFSKANPPVPDDADDRPSRMLPP